MKILGPPSIGCVDIPAWITCYSYLSRVNHQKAGFMMAETFLFLSPALKTVPGT